MALINKPKMMEEAAVSRIPRNAALHLAIFIAVFIAGGIAQLILMSIPMFFIGMSGKTPENAISLISLLTTVGTTAAVIIYCKFLEGRPLSSIGMRKKGAVKQYLVGLLIGLLMFGFTYLLMYMFGGVENFTLSFNINYGIFALFFLGFFLQGMSEEFLCRGFLMNSIGGKNSVYIAIVLSSLMFALLHGINPGLSVLAIINLALYGVFMAVYMIVTDNIWGASAIHTIWNFAQGNIFGVLVSGQGFGDSLITTEIAQGKDFISGGSFGAEGGICTTIILVVAFVLLMVYYKKRKTVSDD